MFKKKTSEIKKESKKKNILIAALLVHAAKIDENYTSVEKEIIKKALINLNLASSEESETILKEAEMEEQESNQIIGFTHTIQWKVR